MRGLRVRRTGGAAWPVSDPRPRLSATPPTYSSSTMPVPIGAEFALSCRRGSELVPLGRTPVAGRRSGGIRPVATERGVRLRGVRSRGVNHGASSFVLAFVVDGPGKWSDGVAELVARPGATSSGSLLRAHHRVTGISVTIGVTALASPSTLWRGGSTLWGGGSTLWGGGSTLWGGGSTLWGGGSTLWRGGSAGPCGLRRGSTRSSRLQRLNPIVPPLRLNRIVQAPPRLNPVVEAQPLWGPTCADNLRRA
jgi:hypothetical protein